jgi:hypothetical protein
MTLNERFWYKADIQVLVVVTFIICYIVAAKRKFMWIK